MIESPCSGSALVLFSGGQDSATALVWAGERFERIETIGFDYGQRHGIELECRTRLRRCLVESGMISATRLGEDHVVDLAVLGELTSSALTSGGRKVVNTAGLPSSFVPGRNLVFLTMAASVAVERELDCLLAGMCQNDSADYPDCRAGSMVALETALGLGLGRSMPIIAPLVRSTKAATWKLAHDMGGDALIALIVEHSHTCYIGDRSIRHQWGYGCADCLACHERERGWRLWMESRSE